MFYVSLSDLFVNNGCLILVSLSWDSGSIEIDVFVKSLILSSSMLLGSPALPHNTTYSPPIMAVAPNKLVKKLAANLC
jgi:hypothetical protein